MPDYRTYLRAKIQAIRHMRGYQVQLTMAAGCQRSILSQVLRGSLELTRDQAAGLCAFWGLSDTESDYFLCLVDLTRCKSASLKQIIERKLQHLRSESANLTKTITMAALSETDARVFYYSSWIPAAVHVLLSVPAYSQPEKIAKRLGLPLKQIQKTLSGLKDAGLVTLTDTKWEVQSRDLNLPHTSALREINHINWRQRAIIDVQKQDEESIHFSAAFSMAEKDAEWMKQKITELIVSAKQRIIASKEEEDLFCFTCDFFRP